MDLLLFGFSEFDTIDQLKHAASAIAAQATGSFGHPHGGFQRRVHVVTSG